MTLYLFSLMFCVKLIAQTPENITAKAKYTLTHNYDTANTSLIISENYILLLGKNTSLYKSLDRQIQDSIMYANFKKTKSMSPPSGKRFSDEQIFFNFKQKKIFSATNSIVGKYYVERSFENIVWNIQSETKIISNLNCQKAVGEFHGRNFTAWFCKDLPFKAGPWKLVGLPGLIIEAKDITNRIEFSLTSFESIANSSETTFFDTKFEEISWDSYVKMSKSIQDDPIGYIDKKFGLKTTLPNNSPLSHHNPLLPKKMINFPLEAVKFYTIQ
ncbi:GLPGLI family protein [Pedobacter alpinus]|uniref:GLPGLI family protein n=2 Tax=Pedobacter alpinus TaxID=1590643 RepID=A0ABW5TP95_9SPHI